MKKSGWLLLPLLYLVSILPTGAQSTDITEQDLREITSYLASDKLEGRKSGSAGADMAAEYILKSFVQSDLKLINKSGYQEFDVVTGAEAGGANQLRFNEKALRYGEDFVALSFSKSGPAQGEMVFAGYGFVFDNDSMNWNDYAEIEVDGKWVMILRGDPEPDKANSPFAEYSGERHKVLLAQDHGAVGVIFVSGPSFDKEDKLLDMFYDKSSALASIPVFHITRAASDMMFQSLDRNITDMESRIFESRAPISFALPIQIYGEAEIMHTSVLAKNVVAMLPGNDPILKNEYVIIGAHYDHLGMGGQGSGSREPDTTAVHNGADDNASGVAGMLEIAAKMAAEKTNRRTIIFVAFSGEEMGLLGSKYFVDNPGINLAQVQAMVNLDMIGRMNEDRTLMVAGTGTSAESENILNELGKRRKFDLSYSPEGFGASDHASFYTKDVPVFFISTGAHDDYHTSRDDAALLDYKFEKLVVDFTLDLVNELANLDKRLVFKEAGPKARPGQGRGYKVTLGIMPDFTGSGSNGLRVDAVRPEGPAGIGGMKKGDVITSLNGKSVGNIYDYMARLKGLEKGMSVSVDVLRNGKHVVLIVQL